MNKAELHMMEVSLRSAIKRRKKMGLPMSEMIWGASTPEIAAEMRRRIPELPEPERWMMML
jgi:hypothetical protein